MIPSDECHIAEKRESDPKWSFLHIRIMNFKAMMAECRPAWQLGRGPARGRRQGRGAGACARGVGSRAKADAWLPSEVKAPDLGGHGFRRTNF